MFKYGQFRRFLSVRTTINPSGQFKFQLPPKHTSVVLFTTPSQLNRVVEHVFELQKTIKGKKLVAVVACVDSMLGQRNGVSELWFRSPVEIGDYTLLPDNVEKNEGVQSQITEAAPIQLDKNWKITVGDTLFQMQLPQGKHSFGVRLASTLFANCEPSTCFFVQPGDHPDNYANLQQLAVKLPREAEDIDESHFRARRWNKLRELQFEENLDEEDRKGACYQVTHYTSNMVEQINDEPAAEYLINSSEVQKTKKDVFLELIDQKDRAKAVGAKKSPLDLLDRIYQITVGGLGWGEKQGTIVLDTIVGDVGHNYCRLYQHDPTMAGRVPSTETGYVKLDAECSDLEESFDDHEGGEEVVYEDVGAMGSENGYSVDGLWHKSHGDASEIAYAKARK